MKLVYFLLDLLRCVIIFLCLLVFILLCYTCSLTLLLSCQVRLHVVFLCCIFYFFLWILSDIQCIVYSLSAIAYYFWLFIVVGRYRLKLMLSWLFAFILKHDYSTSISYCSCHSHGFTTWIPPIFLFLVSSSLWSGLCFHSSRCFRCVKGLIDIHGSRSGLPCNKLVFLVSTSLQFLEDLCPVFSSFPQLLYICISFLQFRHQDSLLNPYPSRETDDGRTKYPSSVRIKRMTNGRRKARQIG